MKVTRVLKGDRFTLIVAEGTGYRSTYAEEPGYELDQFGLSLWITDRELAAARAARQLPAPSEILTSMSE